MNASRPPPPPGARPTYMGRMYARNLRPVVIFTTSISALWAILSGISAFRVVSFDQDHLPGLAPFAIALGALYLGAGVIEAFGCAAACSQRLPLIRLYAFGSIAAAILVVAAGFISTITHFTFKSQFISVCTDLIQGDTVFQSWGFFGHVSANTLDRAEAGTLCRRAWDHDSFSEIVSVVIEILLGALFSTVAFAYYRQTLDPSLTRTAPSQQVRMDRINHNAPYNGPYGGYAPPNLGYAPPAGPPPSQYAPPSGPPPNHGYGASDLPKYEGDSKMDVDAKENPFADFEPSGEHDVTTGRREGFHV